MAVHFSSKADDWTTPQAEFERLNALYGPFDLDVCADKYNTKCPLLISKETDCLRVPWNRVGIKRVFMNPPYGRGIGKFVEQAYEHSLRGLLVVCLLPSRTDTKWFHDYCTKGKIEFIRGRLKFGNAKNSAPFPSMVVVFGLNNKE